MNLMNPKTIFLLLCLFLHAACGSVYAHRPHDNITDVAISPSFHKDGAAFTIVLGVGSGGGMALKRTTDYGDSWKWLNKGLDNVHPYMCIVISPFFGIDGTVFVSTQGDGIYKSSDGGDSWTKANHGIVNLDIRRLVLSPNYHTDNIVLAADAAGKLYRTFDGAKKWEIFYESKKEITSISFLPTDANMEVAIGDRGGSLYHYNDNRWTKTSPVSDCGAITAIAVSPHFKADQTIWIGTEREGILKSVDGGESFSRLNSELSRKHITSLIALSRDQSGTVLLATHWNEAIFRSEDDGESWHQSNHGLSTDIQADAPDFLLPHFKRIAVEGNYCLLAGFDGLFLSNDGGRNWRQLETWPISNISLISLAPADKEDQQSGILAYGGGAYLIPDVRSNDWINEAECLTLAGIKGVRTDSGISDVAFSPDYASDHTIFAATEFELIKTIDNGKSWSRVDIKRPLILRARRKLDYYMRKVSIPSAFRIRIAGFFPQIPGWSTYIAVSPDYEKDKTVFFGTYGIGQCLSTDSGKSCSVVLDTTLKITTSMAISPSFAKDRALFIGVQNEGIYRTEDGGETFKKSDKGVQIVGNIKLAISPEYQTDQTVLVGTGAGLFITQDGGKSWRRAGQRGLPEKGTIMHVAISPNFKEDKTVLLAVKGRGVFKSTDGSKTFLETGSNLINKNEQLKQICFSNLYAQDSTLYGVSSENVYRSLDRGESWKLIQRPVRYEDAWDVIVYKGAWEKVKGGQYSDSTQMRSKVTGSRATLCFYGSGIRWLSEKGPCSGCAKVYIDNKLMEELSLSDMTYQYATRVFACSGLQKGSHAIIVEVCDMKTDKGWVAIDAFEILP